MKCGPTTRSIDEAHARLIEARAKLMDRDIRVGEILCAYTFLEAPGVASLALDVRHIAYNYGQVIAATSEELGRSLVALARGLLHEDRARGDDEKPASRQVGPKRDRRA